MIPVFLVVQKEVLQDDYAHNLGVEITLRAICQDDYEAIQYHTNNCQHEENDSCIIRWFVIYKEVLNHTVTFAEPFVIYDWAGNRIDAEPYLEI